MLKQNTICTDVSKHYSMMVDGVIHRVDMNTGEMFNYYTLPYKSGKGVQVVSEETYSLNCPLKLKEWCLENGYKNTHYLHFDSAKGKEYAGKYYDKLALLMREVKYLNIAFVNRNSLANAWNIPENKLNRYLNKLQDANCFMYETKGLWKRGYIKVIFNPAIATRVKGVQYLYDYLRNKCQLTIDTSNKRYLGKSVIDGLSFDYVVVDDSCIDCFKDDDKDMEVYGIDMFTFLESLNDYWSSDNTTLKTLLHCSDIDFHLIVSGHIEAKNAGKGLSDTLYR